MEQTLAPCTIEEDLLKVERERYPQWTPKVTKDPLMGALAEREQMEWRAADLIVCGSEFVREGIRATGGPVDCCAVVPYGVRPPAQVPSRRFLHRPLRVLTVGAVELRKGAPYVLEAARHLMGKAEFRMAGRLNVTPHAQDLLSSHVSLLGVVPRSEIYQQFAWADVFLLPSICEGSATVCYEALSYGLPVITTPNAGSVVRDSVDGFIVPIRNAEAIVDRIEHLADNEEVWSRMSQNALERAAEFTLDGYGQRLLKELQSCRIQRCQ
jgi:glycosyltransferase involved in cell wall biosynthesis